MRVSSLFNGSLLGKTLALGLVLNTLNSQAAPPPAYGSNSLNTQSSIATNVAPFNSWTPGWVLVDAFAKAQDWVSNPCDFSGWGTGGPLDLDSNRWIRSLAQNQCVYSSIFAGQAGHYPAGTYVLLFEGDGFFITGPSDNEIAYWPGREVETTASGLKRMTFTVDQNTQDENGIMFYLMSLEQDYIRNVRMITPGGVCGRSPTELNRFKYCATPRGGSGQCAVDEQCYDFEQVYFDRFTDPVSEMNNKVVFHPEYIKHYQQYSSIRYMKWSRVEDNPIADFNNRVLPQEATFTRDDRGFPVEYMLAMSNQLNADAYLNIPVMADPSYAPAFGTMVQAQLASNLDVHIEYGNEFFNFAQALPYNHALTQANAPGSGIPSSDDDFTKVAKWSSRQGVVLMNQFRNQFTDPTRVTRVIAGFNPLPAYTQTAVDFENTYQNVDALAMSGYIGPDRQWVDDQARFDSLTLDEVFEEITDGRHLNSGTSLVDLNNVYTQSATLAQSRNLDLILYEAGQHIVSDIAPQSTVDTMLQANRDSRMGTAYTNNFNNFRNAGGTLLFHFLVEDMYNANGSFGLLEFQDDDPTQSPKYQAITDFISNNPCWWTGNACD